MSSYYLRPSLKTSSNEHYRPTESLYECNVTRLGNHTPNIKTDYKKGDNLTNK